jgi:hypothetical protein
VATGKPAFDLAGAGGYVWGLRVSADGRLAVTDAPGATALVCSLAPPEPDGPQPGTDLLWDWLAGEDADKAYRAAWMLAGRLDDVADEVRRRLPPEKGPDPTAGLAGLIADLDSAEFAAREAATRELTALLTRHPVLRDRLRIAAERAESAEVKSRLERVLDEAGPKSPTADDLRRKRVLAAVELAGTPAARKLLAEWAAGTPATPLTIEAKAALDRLAARR